MAVEWDVGFLVDHPCRVGGVDRDLAGELADRFGTAQPFTHVDHEDVGRFGRVADQGDGAPVGAELGDPVDLRHPKPPLGGVEIGVLLGQAGEGIRRFAPHNAPRRRFRPVGDPPPERLVVGIGTGTALLRDRRRFTGEQGHLFLEVCAQPGDRGPVGAQRRSGQQRELGHVDHRPAGDGHAGFHRARCRVAPDADQRRPLFVEVAQVDLVAVDEGDLPPVGAEGDPGRGEGVAAQCLRGAVLRRGQFVGRRRGAQVSDVDVAGVRFGVLGGVQRRPRGEADVAPVGGDRGSARVRGGPFFFFVGAPGRDRDHFAGSQVLAKDASQAVDRALEGEVAPVGADRRGERFACLFGRALGDKLDRAEFSRRGPGAEQRHDEPAQHRGDPAAAPHRTATTKRLTNRLPTSSAARTTIV